MDYKNILIDSFVGSFRVVYWVFIFALSMKLFSFFNLFRESFVEKLKFKDWVVLGVIFSFLYFISKEIYK